MTDIKQQLEDWGKENGHPYYDQPIIDLVHIVEQHISAISEEILSNISIDLQGLDNKKVRELSHSVLDEILTEWPIVKYLELDDSASNRIEDMVFETFDDHIELVLKNAD